MSAGSPPCVDIERFRADLREGGVEEMLGLLLNTFTEDAPTRMAAVEQAMQGGNGDDVASAAHAFKSGAGTIRATALAEALRELEAASHAGQLEQIGALVSQIRDEYDAVARQLRTRNNDN